MIKDDPQRIIKQVEAVLRDAEGWANQCLAIPQRERGVDREVMALAIHEALTTIRNARS